MAQLNGEFRLEDVPDDDRPMGLLPSDRYRLQVIEGDIQLTKRGREQHEGGEEFAKCDQQILLTLEVIGGPFANRRVWDKIQYINRNPTTQRIAQITMGNLLIALGLKAIKDTDELLFRPFDGMIGLEKQSQKSKDEGYPQKNTVRYLPPSRPPMAGHPQSSEPDIAANTKRPNIFKNVQTTEMGKPGSGGAGTRPWLAKHSDFK